MMHIGSAKNWSIKVLIKKGDVNEKVNILVA